MINEYLHNFVRESNRIEGIIRAPTDEELVATDDFLRLREITVQDVEGLVSVYAPGHKLRRYKTLNVMVGGRRCPEGGPEIPHRLGALLSRANSGHDDPFHIHVAYELLHPFTDGNGRSGRAIWAWQMLRTGYGLEIGFLHRFYYQVLADASTPTISAAVDAQNSRAKR